MSELQLPLGPMPTSRAEEIASCHATVYMQLGKSLSVDLNVDWHRWQQARNRAGGKKHPLEQRSAFSRVAGCDRPHVPYHEFLRIEIGRSHAESPAPTVGLGDLLQDFGCGAGGDLLFEGF